MINLSPTSNNWDKDWIAYLQSPKMPNNISTVLLHLWTHVRNIQGVDLPHAGPVDDIPTSYIASWDTDTYHLEIEVHYDGLCEWFFCNRITGEYEGDEQIYCPEVSDKIKKYLETMYS